MKKLTFVDYLLRTLAICLAWLVMFFVYRILLNSGSPIWLDLVGSFFGSGMIFFSSKFANWFFNGERINKE